jgi:phage tail sheath protein FI
MAYQLSPGVNWSEIDLTTIVPAPSMSTGAFVGEFDWGPINEIFTVSSEENLVRYFGPPSANVRRTAQHHAFWTAANFLNYGQNLQLVRVANTRFTKNATDGSNSAVLIENLGSYEANTNFGDSINTAYANNVGMFAARCPGSKGNGLKVSLFPASSQAAANSRIWASWPYKDQFDSAPGTSEYVKNITKTSSYDEMHLIVIDTLGNFTGNRGAILERFSNLSKASDALNSDGTSNYWIDVLTRNSKYIFPLNPSQNVYTNSVQSTPTQAVDTNCNWGNTATQIAALSPRQFTQGILPFPPVDIASMPTSITSTMSTTKVTTVTTAAKKTTTVGNDQYWYTTTLGGVTVNQGFDSSPTDGEIMMGYDLFRDRDEIDISLIMMGSHSANVIQYVIDSIVDGGSSVDSEEYGIITPVGRKDCVVFLSPPYNAVVNNKGYETDRIIDWLNSSGNYAGQGLATFTNYAFMDSGWKKQYDKYNDVYRWIPLNGDIAGICARTDFTNDAWWSPAGLNRGKVLNVAGLAWNPTKPERDILYQNSINPVIQVKGIGTVLFGDKTLTDKPSAFDRINVRRLFIVLEKAIANASKYSLFEFNDEYTRANFIALVEPFLRDIKGKRGIYDFRVVCDESNNTPDVIDSNRFVGDIYVKPARAINYIQLNFVAVRTGVAFSEVVGKF